MFSIPLLMVKIISKRGAIAIYRLSNRPVVERLESQSSGTEMLTTWPLPVMAICRFQPNTTSPIPWKVKNYFLLRNLEPRISDILSDCLLYPTQQTFYGPMPLSFVDPRYYDMFSVDRKNRVSASCYSTVAIYMLCDFLFSSVVASGYTLSEFS